MNKPLPTKDILCLLLSFWLVLHTHAQNRVDVGKSFANITRLSTGGTFQPGDEIEIRITVALNTIGGTATIIDNVKILDTLPAGTTFVPGSLRTATNEGITYKGPFTDGADADMGQISGGAISMVLGKGASGTLGGRIKSDSSKPSLYNSSCIMVACYRVTLDASNNYGDTIIFRGGLITYRMVQPAGSTITYRFSPSMIYLYQNIAACSNGKSISAASDSLGTFASGTVQNRSTALNFNTTYTKQNLNTGSPQDYFYAIVNNVAGNGTTNTNLSIPNAARVFTVWDICGDHTNASNPIIGNPPVAPGTRGGYMVVVNASYKTDTAYRETLSNLCPDTYYEFSAWIRNICSRCGCDSNGRGAGSAGYLPKAGNDSSGVNPNLSFIVDGLVYYTTGNIPYSRTTPWVKYGFTFKTKPGQTSASFIIQNNSPGGGGNDWALDDITVSHCGPSQRLNFNPQVIGCTASPFWVTLVDTIRYQFSNSYIYFKWQKSNVGGTIWTDLTGPGTSGAGMPTLVNGQYEFITSLPPFLVYAGDSGVYYRVVIATSAANLASSNCIFSDQTSVMMRVINCSLVLNGDFLQFRGSIIQENAVLQWHTTGENELARYVIEKSSDALTWHNIGNTTAQNNLNAQYRFIDPNELSVKNYYRLRMEDRKGLYKYSKTIVLTTAPIFDAKLLDVQSDYIKTEVLLPKDGMVRYSLINQQGQIIIQAQEKLMKGINSLTINNTDSSPAGLYVISLQFNGEQKHLKLMKLK